MVNKTILTPTGQWLVAIQSELQSSQYHLALVWRKAIFTLYTRAKFAELGGGYWEGNEVLTVKSTDILH